MTLANTQEISNGDMLLQLYRRQEEMDNTIADLKIEFYETIQQMKKELENSPQKKRLEEFEKRLGTVEDDMKETKQFIEIISTNVTSMSNTIIEMKNQQSADNNLLYSTQKSMITNLWKAFFGILGVLMAIGSAIVYFLR